MFRVILWILCSFVPAVSANDAGLPTQNTPAPPALMLANVYDDPVNLGEYWVSEKYDGVRAYWTGDKFVSRGGNIYTAPAWFTQDFPPVPLDGELWMGRGTFAELSGAVRREVPDEDQWRKIRFMAFDLPSHQGQFDSRLAELKALVAACPSPYLVLVEQFRVPDHETLMVRLRDLVAQGGEGLMLHRGSSLYRAKRSDDLLKVKTFQDAEATVVAHLPGKGKYEGMLGALVVETPGKRRFKLGTGFSDAERASPPPIGSRVTYKYYGKTATGLPRFASFMRVRPDD